MPKRVDNVTCERQVKGWDTLPTYVSVVKFNVPEIWIRFEIKHNKDDEYEPFDNIKKGLLKVVKEWQDEWWTLKENMGRYEFVNLILELYTKALTDCDWDAFKVEYYEAKDQIGKYLDTNKKRIETLNRIKEENKELEKNIKEEKYKQAHISETVQDEVVDNTENLKVEEMVVEKPKRKRTAKTNTTEQPQVVEKEKEKEKEQKKKVVNPLDLLPTSSRKDGLDFNRR